MPFFSKVLLLVTTKTGWLLRSATHQSLQVRAFFGMTHEMFGSLALSSHFCHLVHESQTECTVSFRQPGTANHPFVFGKRISTRVRYGDDMQHQQDGGKDWNSSGFANFLGKHYAWNTPLYNNLSQKINARSLDTLSCLHQVECFSTQHTQFLWMCFPSCPTTELLSWKRILHIRKECTPMLS